MNEVKLSAYYKGTDDKLHLINAWDTPTAENIQLLRDAVRDQLDTEGDYYRKPILVLIDGGKAS